MSDFSDSDIEDTPNALEETFTQATEHVQRTHASLTPNDLLELYALYKQATAGRCDTSKPGIFNLQGRAKWSAWNDLGQMPSEEAKRFYVEKVQKLDPKWYDSLKAGEKQKSVNSWVVHSIEMRPPDDLEHQKPEHEKNAFDYVKEGAGNLTRLRETLTPVQLQQLDEHGMGLIHWATDRNSTEILQFLLASGANVDQRDAEQQTALHYAASCGHADCVSILLNFNADRSAVDGAGQTCLDVAENAEVRALLQK